MRTFTVMQLPQAICLKLIFDSFISLVTLSFSVLLRTAEVNEISIAKWIVEFILIKIIDEAHFDNQSLISQITRA